MTWVLLGEKKTENFRILIKCSATNDCGESMTRCSGRTADKIQRRARRYVRLLRHGSIRSLVGAQEHWQEAARCFSARVWWPSAESSSPEDGIREDSPLPPRPCPTRRRPAVASRRPLRISWSSCVYGAHRSLPTPRAVRKVGRLLRVYNNIIYRYMVRNNIPCIYRVVFVRKSFTLCWRNKSPVLSVGDLPCIYLSLVYIGTGITWVLLGRNTCSGIIWTA